MITTPADVVTDGDTCGNADAETLAACEVGPELTAEGFPELWGSD